MFSANQTQRFIKGSLFVMAGLFSLAAHAHPQPWISNVKIAGTADGCEPAEVSATSWDKRVSFETPDFSVWLGSEDRIERKNCQLTANIEAPQGWTYAIDEIKVSGWAQTAWDVRTTVALSYYQQGEAQTFSAKRDLPNWFRGAYQLKLKPDSQQWASCSGSQRAININTSILARKGPESSGWAYAKVNEMVELRLKWKSCY